MINGAVPCLFYPIAKRMGISLSELLTNSALQKEALIKLSTDYPIGAVIRMTELWAEAASFGMSVSFLSGDFPRLKESLYTDVEELETAVIPQAVNETTKPLIEAAALAVSELEMPLIVGVTAPYTLGAVLNGSEDFMINCMTEPKIVHSFLERLTDFLIAYCLEYKKVGVYAILLAEPSIAMISPAMAEEFSNCYIERLISALQDENFHIIYHNCGAVNEHLSTISKLSADGFHFGSDVDLSLALDAIPKDRMVMGNIDPRLFLSPDTAKLTAAAKSLMEKCRGYDNFILSTGCDLPPHATPQAIDALLNL